MRQYFDLLGAFLKMTLRNKQAIFWLFLFPLVMMGLFGVVFGGGQAKPKLGIVDLDKSKTGAEIRDAFKRAGIVRLRDFDSLSLAKTQLKDGNVDGVVALNKGLGRQLRAAVTANEAARAVRAPGQPGRATGSAPRPTLDRTIAGAPAVKPVRPATVDLYYDPSATFTAQIVRGAVANVLQYVDRSVSGAPTLLALKGHSVRLPSLRYIDFLVPGIIAMTIMNSAMFGLGGTIVTYRERGILRRLKVTPQPLTTFLAAQITNQLIFSILRAILLIAVARALFNVHVVGDYLTLMFVVVVGSLTFVTMAFAVASFAKNREISDTISNLISMPMMFLGGVFFPVENAPAWIRPIIKALPLKYLADAMRGVMIKGETLSAVRLDLWVLTAVTAVLFLVSVKLWRWE